MRITTRYLAANQRQGSRIRATADLSSAVLTIGYPREARDAHRHAADMLAMALGYTAVMPTPIKSSGTGHTYAVVPNS